MGKPKTPREDPADKAARLRERRMTEMERGQTAMESAAGATTDLRSIYGSQPKGTGAGQPLRPLAKKTPTESMVDRFMTQFFKA